MAGFFRLCFNFRAWSLCATAILFTLIRRRPKMTTAAQENSCSPPRIAVWRPRPISMTPRAGKYYFCTHFPMQMCSISTEYCIGHVNDLIDAVATRRDEMKEEKCTITLLIMLSFKDAASIWTHPIHLLCKHICASFPSRHTLITVSNAFKNVTFKIKTTLL